jgi:hypothetical protein
MLVESGHIHNSSSPPESSEVVLLGVHKLPMVVKIVQKLTAFQSLSLPLLLLQP